MSDSKIRGRALTLAAMAAGTALGIGTTELRGVERALGDILAEPAFARDRALEEALLDFAGCAVVITHDRWFLDRVATHILAFEGDSTATWFEGSWEEYAAWVTETRGPEAL